MEFKKNSTEKKLIYNINVITLLIITICTFGVAFFATHMYYKMIYTMMLLLFLSLLGFFKQALKFILAYIISFIWLMINIKHSLTVPAPMLLTFLITSIPMLMTAFVMVQVPLGKTTVALRQLKIPEKLILVTIVTLRFVPTTLSEILEIKNAMKVRGFLTSPLKVIMHPIKTFEYVVVPLIFSSLKTANELAASCVARGIESPKIKSGYYVNKAHIFDVALTAIFLGSSIIFLI